MSKFLDKAGLTYFWQKVKSYIDSHSGSGGAEEVYSTEETRIGTWIDGKPLYRKVIQFTISQGYNADLHSLNIDYATVYGSVIFPGMSCFPLNYNDNNSFISAYLDSRMRLAIYYSEKDWTGQQAYAVIEYTKTTD